MAQLDPEVVGSIVGPIVGVPGIIVFTYLIIRFKLKKKELEMRGKELEMRGSDAELGPVVDALRDDLEQLADMQEHTRAQLVDMQERLDFAERLLAAGRA
jgi:hypothetical protein